MDTKGVDIMFRKILEMFGFVAKTETAVGNNVIEIKQEPAEEVVEVVAKVKKPRAKAVKKTEDMVKHVADKPRKPRKTKKVES
jgi:hypothetical protein